MNKNLFFYITGGLLALLLIIYAISLLNGLVKSTSVISQTDLSGNQPVENFNLEKFKELKIAK